MSLLWSVWNDIISTKEIAFNAKHVTLFLLGVLTCIGRHHSARILWMELNSCSESCGQSVPQGTILFFTFLFGSSPEKMYRSLASLC